MTDAAKPNLSCNCGLAASGMAYNPMWRCPQHIGGGDFVRLIARLDAAEAVIVNHIAEINEDQDFLDWQKLSGLLVGIHE